MKIQINKAIYNFESLGSPDRKEFLDKVPAIQKMACMLNSATLVQDPYEVVVPEESIKRQQENASVIFDYSVNGICPDEALDVDSIFLDFMAFCLQAKAAQELFSVDVSSEMVEKVMAISLLRNRLDSLVFGKSIDAVILEPDSDEFTVNEIAVLGRMSELSVRNATRPKAPDRLLTYKEAGRTLVTAVEASRWLGNRRNFKPTQLLGKR